MEVLKYLTLKEGTSIDHRPTPILVEECQSGWSKVSERTSSAMTDSIHFGHWKAGYMDDNIGIVYTAMANIPYLTGYSPRRW